MSDNPNPITDPSTENDSFDMKTTPRGGIPDLRDYMRFDKKLPCKFFEVLQGV